MAPSVVAPGQAITITVAAAGRIPVIVADIIVTSVHVDRPNGPLLVEMPCGVCSPLVLLPGHSASLSIQVPSTVSPGLYFLRVAFSTAGTVGFESYPLLVGGGGFFPLLYLLPPNPPEGTTVRLGTTTSFFLGGGSCGGFPYIAAVSNSTNTGFEMPGGGFLALDPFTPFWSLSFPSPHPALFSSLQGQMTVWGTAIFAIALPNDSALLHTQIAVQAVVIPPGTMAPIASNPLTLRVIP